LEEEAAELRFGASAARLPSSSSLIFMISATLTPHLNLVAQNIQLYFK